NPPEVLWQECACKHPGADRKTCTARIHDRNRADCCVTRLVPKREQNVSGHSAKTRVTGVHKYHSPGKHGACTIERPACCLDSIHGGERLRGIDVPEDFAIGRRKGAKVS